MPILFAELCLFSLLDSSSSDSEGDSSSDSELIESEDYEEDSFSHMEDSNTVCAIRVILVHPSTNYILCTLGGAD